MSKVQMLRAFVNQRLTAAAEEIFELFVTTIAEYEEELGRSKEENEQQRKLLDAVCNPEVRLHRADAQQLLVVKKEIKQEDTKPPHIKEEQEELWISQEGEQLQGLEEADIKFPFTSVPVKSEEDEEKAQSSQLHESQTEANREAERTGADGEDCGGPEPARNSDPDSPLQPATHEKTSDSSEPETDASGDWEETEEPQSGLNSLQNNEEPGSDVEPLQKRTGVPKKVKTFCCSLCGKRFSRKYSLTTHMRLHSEGKHLTCSVCKAIFSHSSTLAVHMRTHTGEKPFSCSVCSKRFAQLPTLKQHLTVHTGEKPFSCSVCRKTFSRHSNLTRHLTVHSAEKQFSCSVCDKRFTDYSNLKRHLTKHTGEKSFSCSVCRKKFARHSNLTRHLTVHTGEKSFSCSVCDKRFTDYSNLKQHLTVHTGEKPFSCSVCTKVFAHHSNLKQHLTVHTGEKSFSCSVCRQKFSRHSNLTRHLTVHSGE
ncbi:gastrula zinc finger protein XlCGF57.1-like isoform X2 [Sander lucioperca]|uniref:gastrula zinc finger protein XlCGF57.1-like isoform X2 n=1 Tax=Sander lucioperca TaxID=283035 RepID=UPI0016539C31|nr:gastrula zinc finger protein XlCGF57.1-like isoform X2 [Sander lucioperca]